MDSAADTQRGVGVHGDHKAAQPLRDPVTEGEDHHPGGGAKGHWAEGQTGRQRGRGTWGQGRGWRDGERGTKGERNEGGEGRGSGGERDTGEWGEKAGGCQVPPKGT